MHTGHDAVLLMDGYQTTRSEASGNKPGHRQVAEGIDYRSIGSAMRHITETVCACMYGVVGLVIYLLIVHAIVSESVIAEAALLLRDGLKPKA